MTVPSVTAALAPTILPTPPQVPNPAGFGLGTIIGSGLTLFGIFLGRHFFDSPLWDDQVLLSWAVIFGGSIGNVIHTKLRARVPDALAQAQLEKVQLEIEVLKEKAQEASKVREEERIAAERRAREEADRRIQESNRLVQQRLEQQAESEEQQNVLVQQVAPAKVRGD